MCREGKFNGALRLLSLPYSTVLWEHGPSSPVFSFFSIRSFHAVCSAPRQYVLVGRGQADVGRAVPAPSAMDGKKQIGRPAMNSACCSGVSIRLP